MVAATPQWFGWCKNGNGPWRRLLIAKSAGEALDRLLALSRGLSGECQLLALLPGRHPDTATGCRPVRTRRVGRTFTIFPEQREGAPAR